MIEDNGDLQFHQAAWPMFFKTCGQVLGREKRILQVELGDVVIE